jgi:hypothetical protein
MELTTTYTSRGVVDITTRRAVSGWTSLGIGILVFSAGLFFVDLDDLAKVLMAAMLVSFLAWALMLLVGRALLRFVRVFKVPAMPQPDDVSWSRVWEVTL